MALRVLLADESSTIKKVMQLALHDFAVEVKAVPVGLDVLAVSKTFKPDIVFADVLLTKRSGYEVCSDLKNDPETAHIPVVLMWSGFMELDEAKASGCRAERRLEKPFDADTLRNIVKDLVVKTKANPLSEYLTFPHMPDFAEPQNPLNNEGFSNEEPLGEIYAIPDDSGSGYAVNENEFDMPQDEEFSQVPLTATPRHDDGQQKDSDWSHQDLSQLSQVRIETNGNFEEISFEPEEVVSKVVLRTNTPPPKTPPPTNGNASGSARPSATATINSTTQQQQQSMPGTTMAPKNNAPSSSNTSESVKTQSQLDINPELVEKIIREQARELIESICWKVLPEIAERVVREELQKILRDADK